MRLVIGALLTAGLACWAGPTVAGQAVVAPAAPPSQGQPAAPGGEHRHEAPEPPSGGSAGSETQPRSPAAVPPFIPPITDADRAAAFPSVKGHAVHDKAVNTYVLFDRLELLGGDGPNGVALDSTGWIGTDIDRFWFRADGEGDRNHLGKGTVDLLYGRAISRWWGLVGGARQDIQPGAAQTWGAIGIQGLAPYWFEVEATAYVGAGGRTQFRARTEYDVLVSNRLIVQPLIEVELSGKADPERGMGAGLNSADFGVRVRYELRRELAPYVGVTWDRKFFGTADYAAAAGERSGGARLAVGVRWWR